MQKSNKAMFLTFVHILVDETTEAEPLTRKQILERMEQTGCYISKHLFFNYLKSMEEAGIIIKRRQLPKRTRGPFLYWYADGWI